MITDQYGAVTSRKDFAAFGDETITPQRTADLGYTPPAVRQDYTGYQKDGESGLEYAQARYYNSQHGRFTSVDPLNASATVRDPQTFNRYSYVMNSPYKFTDPLGLVACCTESQLESIIRMEIGGRKWTRRDGTRTSIDERSQKKLIRKILPAARLQAQMSSKAQNALNAQAITGSNITTTISESNPATTSTTSTGQSTQDQRELNVGASSSVKSGTTRGTSNDYSRTETLAPGITKTTSITPGRAQELDQQASEHIGTASETVGRLLDGTTVETINWGPRDKATGLQIGISEGPAQIQNMAPTVNVILNYIDREVRKHVNEKTNPVKKRDN